MGSLAMPFLVIYTFQVALLTKVRLYREVHKARSRRRGSLVALKKIIMHNEKDGVCDINRR